MKSLYTLLFISLMAPLALIGQGTALADCDESTAFPVGEADERIQSSLPLRVGQQYDYCISASDDQLPLDGVTAANLSLTTPGGGTLPVEVTVTTITDAGNTSEVLTMSGDQVDVVTGTILHLSIRPLEVGMGTLTVTPVGLADIFLDEEMVDFTVEAALPVVWQSSLAARNTGKLNQFNWSVSDQRDVANYELQRESNGDFTTVRTINVIEGGSGEIAYSTTDELHTEDAYYRVKQTDFDGSSSYSNTISVPGTVAEASLLVYPNPARNLLSYNYGGELSAVSLVNLVGAQVRSLTAPAARGDFDVSDLPSGIYILSAIGTDGSRQARRVRVAR